MSGPFDDEKIKKAEYDFSLLKLAPIHREMISNIADVLAKYIELSQQALMGLCWTAIREFQIKKKILAENIAKQEPAIRIAMVDEIFKILSVKLKEILLKPSDKPIIEKAIKEGFEYYKETYGYRENPNYL